MSICKHDNRTVYLNFPKMLCLCSVKARSWQTFDKSMSSVISLWTSITIKLFRRDWVIVDRKYVLIILNALNDLSLVAFVAGMIRTRITTLTISSIKILSLFVIPLRNVTMPFNDASILSLHSNIVEDTVNWHRRFCSWMSSLWKFKTSLISFSYSFPLTKLSRSCSVLMSTLKSSWSNLSLIAFAMWSTASKYFCLKKYFGVAGNSVGTCQIWLAFYVGLEALDHLTPTFLDLAFVIPFPKTDRSIEFSHRYSLDSMLSHRTAYI